MSAGYTAVHWTRSKLVYDAVLAAGLALYIAAFLAFELAHAWPADRLEWIGIRIRACGSAALLMLSLILAIGPLCRLYPALHPLLANRRHFGVLTFVVALLHFAFMIEWYVARGALPSLLVELTTTGDYAKFIGFPFKVLGLLALGILLVMAVTSHDYWLAFLGSPLWKAIHMAVYAAYGLAVMHVALGAMQWNRSPLVPTLLGLSLAIVSGLHIAAALRERRRDLAALRAPTADGWLPVAAPADIPDRGAVIVRERNGDRIAVFRDGNRISAVTNACAHQNGPIGEGRVIDGCITCPWHGWQYRIEDGRAPAPFTERLATYKVRLRDGRIEVHPIALAPGTPAALTL